MHLYEWLIVLEEEFGLVIRFPHFQHFGKQLLAVLAILLLVQKFHWLTNIHCLFDSILKRQQMSHCTPSEKLSIFPLLAPQLSFIMCVTLADRTHLEYSLSRVLFILSFASNEPAWYIDFCSKNQSYNICLPYVSFQLLEAIDSQFWRTYYSSNNIPCILKIPSSLLWCFYFHYKIGSNVHS